MSKYHIVVNHMPRLNYVCLICNEVDSSFRFVLCFSVSFELSAQIFTVYNLIKVKKTAKIMK